MLMAQETCLNYQLSCSQICFVFGELMIFNQFIPRNYQILVRALGLLKHQHTATINYEIYTYMHTPLSLAHPLFHRYRTRVFSNTSSVEHHVHLRIKKKSKSQRERKENSNLEFHLIIKLIASLSPSSQLICATQHPQA